MHALDIRWPLGMIFLLTGLILMGYGAYGDELGGELNAGWGVVLVTFGALMLYLARRGAKRHDLHD